jgi:hypothetical protein
MRELHGNGEWQSNEHHVANHGTIDHKIIIIIIIIIFLLDVTLGSDNFKSL